MFYVLKMTSIYSRYHGNLYFPYKIHVYSSVLYIIIVTICYCAIARRYPLVRGNSQFCEKYFKTIDSQHLCQAYNIKCLANFEEGRIAETLDFSIFLSVFIPSVYEYKFKTLCNNHILKFVYNSSVSAS